MLKENGNKCRACLISVFGLLKTNVFILKFGFVRLFHISSGVYGPISTKLGRTVGGGSGQKLRPLVTMATNMQSWQPRKCVCFLGQISHENHTRPGGKNAWARREIRLRVSVSMATFLLEL